ncbi:MAG: pyruvate kinase [Flavobacteriaceae bacterium]|nr:pyruvate kinase [Flavobacteriaceae bacterium]
MNFIKKTKIVATLGPASSSEDVIEKMILEGVNVFRVNFSHADYSDVSDRIDMIRKVDKKLKTNTSILADLQGPKLRVGKMEEGAFVNPGDEVTFLTDAPFVGNAKKAYMNYKSFPKDVSPGERILLDDGKLIFEVLATNKNNQVDATVIQGGPFKSNKGVNLPNTKISLPALTEKDIQDAEFIFTQDVDWIALSFVRFSQDLIDLTELMVKHTDKKIPIIAKIEKPEALENIDKIISYCDGLMVARGDLGVEVPAHEVPLIQKRLVHLAKKARIPIIIATQMMETMIDSLTPTRAEVNDVANSVMDGADAVMLSGETSVGQYPVEVIRTMSNILTSVESSSLIKVPQDAPTIRTKRFITKSICYHAAHIANDIEAKAICTLTNSGYTAFQISAWRPSAYVLVYTSNTRILNRLGLLWGVKTFYYNNLNSTDMTVEEINEMAFKAGYVEKEDMIVNLTAMPIETKGMVNTLRVSTI